MMACARLASAGPESPRRRRAATSVPAALRTPSFPSKGTVSLNTAGTPASSSTSMHPAKSVSTSSAATASSSVGGLRALARRRCRADSSRRLFIKASPPRALSSRRTASSVPSAL